MNAIPNLRGYQILDSIHIKQNKDSIIFTCLILYQCRLDTIQGQVITVNGSISAETAMRQLTGFIVNDDDT